MQTRVYEQWAMTTTDGDLRTVFLKQPRFLPRWQNQSKSGTVPNTSATISINAEYELSRYWQKYYKAW